METPHSASPNLRLRQERIQRHWRQQKLAELLGTTQVTVSRWEGGSQQPSAYFREKLCELFGKSAQELGLIPMALPYSSLQQDTSGVELSPPYSSLQQDTSGVEPAQSALAPFSGLWTVPYLRNPHFTGREDLLEQLTQQLSFQGEGKADQVCRTALTQPRAIKGLGGIGKTQIAVEYAYRAREQGRYSHVFWITAANEETLLASFLELAELLPDFAQREEKDQHKLLAAIHRWLHACPEPWLLLVDNADDPAVVQPFLPQQGPGSILLTTRATAIGWLAPSLEVEGMGMMEGTRFLLHRAQRLPASDEESNEASNVVIALDGFPLALDQAGAYIEETGCSFGEYLHLYERHRGKLLARRGKQATNYPDSVATTWSLSFQHIAQSYPAASELLRLCAFLSPDHIPEELLTQRAACWPPRLQEAVSDPFSFNEMLEALLAFSLVKRLAQERLLSLHRLVQAVQLDRMEQEEQGQWAQRVISAVNVLFPADPKEEVETWPLCLRYLEQVQACYLLIERYDLHLSEAAHLLERAGIYLREHASHSLAEQLFQRALVITEQVSGPEHLQVASLLNNLSVLYFEQGRYEQSELLSERALRITEQAVGPDHFQNTIPLSHLGRLYLEQGKYEQAEPLLERALHITEQTVGPDHPRLAVALNNLGVLYRQRSKYEQARLLFEQALSIRRNALCSNHPDVASGLTNLGILYAEQGKYEQAEPLFEQTLQVWEQALGSHHPRLATALNNLGELYREQGKYEQAEPLFKRALHIWEQTLGPDYIEIAMLLNGLGALYEEQNRYEQAKLSLERAMHIFAQSLGLYHPQVAHTLNSLANLAQKQDQYEQAEELYRRALAIRQQHLDPLHLATADTLHDLALLKQTRQQFTEALELYEQALAIREQVLGVEHSKTIDTRQRLSSVLRSLNEIEEVVFLEAYQENGTAKG